MHYYNKHYLYSLVPSFSVLQATESWAGPGNEATQKVVRTNEVARLVSSTFPTTENFSPPLGYLYLLSGFAANALTVAKLYSQEHALAQEI